MLINKKVVFLLLLVPAMVGFARGEYRGGGEYHGGYENRGADDRALEYPGADRALENRAVENRAVNNAVDAAAGAGAAGVYGPEYVPVPQPQQPQTINIVTPQVAPQK